MNPAFPAALYLVDGWEQAGDLVSGLFCAAVRARPDAVLGFATGRTATEIYPPLIRKARQEGVDFGRVRCFNLDEYLGLPQSDPQAYSAEMRRGLYDHLGLNPANIFLFDGMAADPAHEAGRCERALAAAGGIDVQLVGLGENGHIGFNEPGSPGDSRTRAVRLSETSRRANARYFPTPDAVPTHAITMGVGTILGARRIVMVALGAHKATPVARMFHDPAGPAMPATFLRGHGNVTLVLDRLSAGGLPPQVLSEARNPGTA